MTHPQDETVIEPCADPLDSASMIEAAALQENILAARWRSRQMQEPMADGTYRVTDCDECGNEIGDERLRIAPMNLWCVECAQAHETRQRRRV